MTGERSTQQRRTIREVLEQADRPLAIQEILEAAQSDVPGLGIATVYRFVKALVDEGWLHPVDVPGESARFELAGRHHHHHFHCRKCDRMFDIPGCTENVARSLPKGFKVESHEVMLYGLCAGCAPSVRRK